MRAGSCAAREDCTGNSVGYNCVEGRCGCGNANADCPAGNLCKKAKCILKGVFCDARSDCVQSSKGLGCYTGKCGCNDNDCPNTGSLCNQGRCSQGFGGPGGPPPELLGLGGPGGPPPGGPGNLFG